MTFLSPSFIFVFLPVVLAIYAAVPKFRRIDLLPMISAAFFVCINIQDLLSLIYFFSIAVASAVTLKIYKKTKRRGCLILLEILAFAAALASLLYSFIFGSEAIYHAGLLMCLMAVMSMCSDIAKNEGRAPDTVWEAMIYLTFFPVMLAGPFVRYGDFIEKLDGVSVSVDNFLKGVVRFMIGFIKCVAISAVLGRVYDEVTLLNGEFGFLVCVVIAAVCGVRIYTFFSGYSDMARGIALMIGLNIKKDFKDPFANVTVTDYAKRFFRSLSEFAKLYIMIPIDTLFGGRAVGKIVACAFAGCYYIFIISPSPSIALLLYLPVSLLAYFVLIRPKEKRTLICGVLKVPCALLTFFTVSFIWLLISAGSTEAFAELMKSVLSKPFAYASYDVKEIVFSAEHIIIPAFSAILVFVISRALNVENLEPDEEISVRALIIRSASMTVLAAMFILSVTMLLPQFPGVVSYANVFRFV